MDLTRPRHPACVQYDDDCEDFMTYPKAKFVSEFGSQVRGGGGARGLAQHCMHGCTGRAHADMA